MTDYRKSNSKEVYVIFSPGRTGSHIILESLCGSVADPGGLCNATCYWDNKNLIPYIPYNQSNNVVIHTHDLSRTCSELKLDLTNVTLILSHRRDTFAQAMSFVVAKLTDEWNGRDYSNKLAAPVFVASDKFKKIFLEFQQWPGIIPQLNQYKKVVSIYYEDLYDHAAEHIASKLDIAYNEILVGKIHKKSPYLYKDWVLNWEELKKEFT